MIARQGANLVKNFLRAKTPEGLRRLMRRQNVIDKVGHDYTEIWTGKEWIAWYYIKISLNSTEGESNDGVS